jgi:hypothetical protein
VSVRTILIAVLLALAGAIGVQSEDLAAIIQGSYLVARSPQATVRFRMTIHDGQGDKIREVVVYLTNAAKGGNLLAKVVSPASLSAMKYLRIGSEKGALQQWLATSRGVRRLGEGGGDERLFGSDFAIGDFSPYDAVSYRIARDPDRETAASWALSLEPRSSVQQKKIVQVDRTTSLITAVDTLDQAGKVERSYRVEAIAGPAAAPYPRLSRMSDPSRGSWTLMEVLSIDITTPIADRVFNPAALE